MIFNKENLKKLSGKFLKQNLSKHMDFDPLGSYTGSPADPNDIPVQDADDL